MAPHPLTAAPLPVLVFDGDCAFCTTSAGVITRRLRRSPDDYAVQPWQHLDLDALGLTPEDGRRIGRAVRETGHRLHRLQSGN